MFDKENTQFLRRVLCLGILQLILMTILLGRMYVLQIIEGYYYHRLAEGNRIATRPLIPLRGQLYDRRGVSLAQNKTSFRLVLVTDKKDKAEESFEKLSHFIFLSEEEKKGLLKIIQKKRGFETLIIKDNLTWPEVSAVELHLAELPGVSIEVGFVRTYPEKLSGAHFLGYIGSPSENEQEEETFLAIPGVKVGKAGLEKYLETRLHGTPGHSAFEVNAKRKIVRELHQTPSIPGEDVHLTLDARLQAHAQEVLSIYESGSAVVLDIQKGDILALVSNPSFDPNLFPQGISYKNWDELRDNPYVPLTNKVISGVYPPGSTIKLFVALAALQSGIINKSTTIYCPGYIYVGDHKFHCMHSHGSVNVSRAITESCDVFFYEVAKKLGVDRLSTLLQNMGLGMGNFDGFPYSKKGLVPTKAWKKEKKNSHWTVSDTIQMSIGQGYMGATPLELAIAVARLVSGKRLNPRLEGRDDVVFEDMGYDQEHLEIILKAMQDTANDPRGTAYRWRIPFEGMEMAGKTGTSQVRRITLQQRKEGQTKTYHLPWKYREHGLFIGYAPVHAPRYAIAVVIEHTGGAGRAVQAARDILLKAQLLEKETTL